MKTHKYVIALTLVAAALGNCVQAKHLQKDWYTQLASTPKADPTYNLLSDNIKKDAADVDQINTIFQDPSAANMTAFQKKHKNDITGATNGKITQLRQAHQRKTSFVHGRLKEIQSAQQRMHKAIRKAKGFVTNNALDIHESSQEVSEALGKDEPAYTAKLDKKSAKEARIKAKADKEKQTLEDKRRIKQERREAARARTLRNRPSKRKAPAVLENKYNNHF